MAPISRFGTTSRGGAPDDEKQKARLRALNDLGNQGIAKPRGNYSDPGAKSTILGPGPGAPLPKAEITQAEVSRLNGPKPNLGPAPVQSSVQANADAKKANHESALEKAKQDQKAAVHAEAEKNRRAGQGGLVGRQEDERQAALEQLQADKAKNLQGTAARAGAAGLGLSGGTNTLMADTARVADRTAITSMAALDKSQLDDRFTDVQREAALADLEAADHRDYDGDGLIAGNPAGAEIADDDKLEAFNKVAANVKGDDGTKDGSRAHPFQVPPEAVDEIEKYGTKIKDYPQQQDGGSLWQGPDGLFYRVRAQ